MSTARECKPCLRIRGLVTQHSYGVPGQTFVEEGALEEEGDHAGAEVLTELGQIGAWHMDKPPLPVESVFQEDSMEVRIPPRELTCGGVGDDGGALDPPPCRRVVEALDHAVDQLADLPVEPPVKIESEDFHAFDVDLNSCAKS
jgi:hypothetical protein